MARSSRLSDLVWLPSNLASSELAFINYGLFVVNVRQGYNFVFSPNEFNNDGTIVVQSGTLKIGVGGEHNGMFYL